MSDSFALLGAQKGIFIQWKMNPQSLQYNLPFIYAIPDDLSTERLIGVLEAMIELHPQLRTCYEMGDDGDVLQRVLPKGNPVEQIQISEADLESFLTSSARPFDLLSEIPVRFTIISTETKRYFFHDIHHISFDGMSYAIFTKDLEILLSGGVPDQEIMPLPQCVQMEQTRREENLEKDLAFFDSILRDQPTSELPPRSVRNPDQIQKTTQIWDGKLINDFSKEHSYSANILFSSALAIVLSRFNRENCASWCMISHGRPCPESLGTFAGFSRALPISVVPQLDESVLDFYERIRLLTRDILKHQTPTTEELLHRYDLTPAIFFVFQKGTDDHFKGTLIARRLPVSDSIMPIALEVFFRDDYYEIRAEYNSGTYDVAMMEALLKSWKTVLFAMLKDPSQKCGDLETVTPEEKAALLELGTGELLEFDTSKTIVDHFRQQVAEHPDQTAVVFQEKSLTYGELDDLTERLAARLLELGAGREKMVGVMIDRSELLAVYPLAILKAGAAYVPLDSHFPEDRLSYMIENTGLDIILTDKNLANQILPHFQGKIFDSAQLSELPPSKEKLAGPLPENAFVVIYTSGTTGKPKGCVLEHRSMLNFCQWYVKDLSMTSSDRVTAYSNFGFDAHMIDFYPTWICGGTIYVISSEMRLNLPELARYISENKISMSALTTRLGQQLAEAWPDILSKSLLVGGEALISIQRPHYRMINAYGPTECTITATAYNLVKQEEDLPPIGRPLANYQTHILDNSGHLLPRGVVGELYIGGLGVARGYLGLPEMNARRFIKNPFGEGRIYQTGDRVRWNENGDIEYIGRMDNQVKLRGFRIELGEVEHALKSCESITDAVALVREVGGNQTLCAWFTADQHVDLDKLRQFLAGSLTEYMIPSCFLQMEKFPFNANGKVDRKKLPDISLEEAEESTEERGPRILNRLETELAGIVEKLLGISQVGLGVNLVRLGLTSLMAIKLAIQIEKKFHVALNVTSLMGSCSLLDLENSILENWLESFGSNPQNISMKNANAQNENAKNGTIKTGETKNTGVENAIVANAGIKAGGVGNPEAGNARAENTEVGNDGVNAGRTQNIEAENDGAEAGETEKVGAKTDGTQSGGAGNIGANNIGAGNAGTDSENIMETSLLTPPQLGIYYDCVKEPESTAYNIPMIYRFPANFDADRLAESLKKVLTNHPVFFSRFERHGEEIIQVYSRQVTPAVERLTLNIDEFQKFRDEFTRPFALKDDSLYRAAVIKTPEEVALLLDVHHLIADGFSISLILYELAEVFSGNDLMPERCAYAEYSRKESEWSNSPKRQTADDFFARQLSSVESVCEIEPDFNADPQSGHLAEEVFLIDPKSVETFCRSNDITAASLFLAGTCLGLSRFTNSRTVPISMISSGRSDLRLQNTVGMFVRTLPFCAIMDPKKISRDYLQCINGQLRETLVNENVSFVELSAKYGYQPKIMFACELGVVEELPIGGVVPQLCPLRLEKPKFPVSVHIENRQEQIAVVVQYNDALYGSFRMKMLAGSLAQSVLAIMKSPQEEIGGLSLITVEQKKMLEEFRCRAEAPIEEELLHRLFEKRVDETPDKTALIASDGQWTFAELDNMSNRIAQALIARGITQGDRIVHLLPRTGRVLMTTFGILKSGAAFIPCDPDYPQERIEQIIEDSGAKMVITTSELAYQYGTLGVDVEELLKENNSGRPAIAIQPNDLAYLIYTSGSTGKPKGVMLEHRGICNYVTPHPATPHVCAIREEARALLSITTVSFDMSFKEIMVALCNGVTLVFADSDQTRHPGRLAELFESTGADAFNATPSRMKQFLEHSEFRKALGQCRIVMAGGEVFPKILLKELRKVTKARIFNTYGPTEITVSSNCKELESADRTPVIGRPLLNYREFIVDADGNELPPGAVGELLIGGPGVARGYVNLPEKTADAFIEFQGQRVYRSGDRAEWLQNGDVAVHGRIDNQLKLRGLRIEASEVENAVASFEGIRQAAVAVRAIENAEYLCCWFAAEKAIDTNALKDELKKSLPDYMIPSAFSQLDSIPVNINGKTDYKALSTPTFVASSDYVEPCGENENILCDIFAKVLNRKQIGALDNFFDLGGTSLSVTQIIVETENRTLDITYKDVFANPTPRALARLLDDSSRKGSDVFDQDISDQDVSAHGKITDPKNKKNDDTDQDQMANDSNAGNKKILPVRRGDSVIEDYDYSSIDELLRENSIESFRTGESQKIGSLLLTGSTGFLGVHLLAAFLDQEEGTAYCLVRPKKDQTIEKRLKTILFYYFGGKYENEIGKRVIAVPGDITDPESLKHLEAFDIDCVINCAANVKHFSMRSDIDDINRKGVQNLIDFCLKKRSRLVQISTTSVAGSREKERILPENCLTEQLLYFGQDVSNQYVHSKFLAERSILEAVSKGLSAKIIRVGNLAARARDGEFQANFGSNSFVGRLRALYCVGKVPYSMAGQTAEFAPIDSTADAILKLIQTPEKCRVFHLYNPHSVLFGDIFIAMQKCGLNIDFAEENDYHEAYEKAAANPNYVKYLSSLFAYRASSSQPMVLVPKANDFTLQILFRLGWQWPVIPDSYLVKFVDMLQSLGFFI